MGTENQYIISDEDWEETFKARHKLTNSPIRREFDWKVRMRYFNTPSITAATYTVYSQSIKTPLLFSHFVMLQPCVQIISINFFLINNIP